MDSTENSEVPSTNPKVKLLLSEDQENEETHNTAKANTTAENSIEGALLEREKLVDLPILCLSSGLEHKAPLSELSSWTSLSLTLDGRDKITKVLQYSCRFLTWWYSSSDHTKVQAECYSSLYKSLTQSRKAYRLGRTITEFHKLRKNPIFQDTSSSPRPKNTSKNEKVDFHDKAFKK